MKATLHSVISECFNLRFDAATELLAEVLHKEYRAACLALEIHSSAHNHGWKACHTKEYFRKRAKVMLF